MFKKAAEEIAKDIYIHRFDDDINYPCVLQAITVGVLKGAEFGYNKANEWHYVKDGDLPTEDLRLAIIEVEDCGYLLCEYREGVWYDEGSSSVCKDWITRNIKRWKVIVLPKEIE